MMDAHHLNHLRLLVLRHFLPEALQIGTLLDLPAVNGCDRELIIRMVHACALAGLLTTCGETSGKWYFTSRAGWVVVTVLESERR